MVISKFMNIAITGHTQGIGAALFGVFQKHGHSVKGYSRSNGYDISTEFDKIINDIQDCDVFVNNAYYPKYQTMLLEKIYRIWQGKNKTIINISSKQSRVDLEWAKEYIEDKRNQNNFTNQTICNAFPRILNVQPGLVDTEMSSIFKAPTSMSAQDVAELIYTLWSLPNISVQDITFDAVNLEWKDIQLTNY